MRTVKIRCHVAIPVYSSRSALKTWSTRRPRLGSSWRYCPLFCVNKALISPVLVTINYATLWAYWQSNQWWMQIQESASGPLKCHYVTAWWWEDINKSAGLAPIYWVFWRKSVDLVLDPLCACSCADSGLSQIWDSWLAGVALVLESLLSILNTSSSSFSVYWSEYLSLVTSEAMGHFAKDQEPRFWQYDVHVPWVYIWVEGSFMVPNHKADMKVPLHKPLIHVYIFFIC